MHNLQVYKEYFDRAYPDYADNEYQSIADIVSALPTTEDAVNILSSQEANEFLNLLLPVVKIKNYKSQVPFPTTLFEVTRILIAIKNDSADTALTDNGQHYALFSSLLELQGYQVPTVSAVFHFCHPSLYPIVDRNIQEACRLLHESCSAEFDNLEPPKLPVANTTNKNKVNKYRQFIAFLTKIKELHNAKFDTAYTYRDLDKALMVYGVTELKANAENL